MELAHAMPAVSFGTLRPMGTDVAERAPTDEEQRLAAAAAAGDGDAFATLYERYEQRAYNLAYRVTGSEEDAADAVQDAFLGVLRRLPAHGGGELAFGSYVFTATRNACYDLMQKRRRAEPSDSIPESAAPVGGGAGGLGLDPGDPEDDPSRRQLLASQRSEIREANGRLPERQREALALRELEGLSYDEIAAIMGMNRNSVAQLISRARLNLRAELRGTALESVATSSADCERALPLIASRDDGQLEDGAEATWLGAHLAACGTCQVRVQAMHEAGASYRAWAPIAVAPWLFEETMAKAAELVGADWSETIARRAASHRGRGAPGRRRWSLVGGSLVTLVLAGLLLARAVDDRGMSEQIPVVEGRTVDAAADSVPPADAKGQKGKQPSSPDAPVSTASAPVQEDPVAEPAGTTLAAGGGPPDTGPERSVSRSEQTGTPQRKEGPTVTVVPEVTPPEEPEAVPPPAPEPEPPVREPEQPPKEPEPPRPPPGKPPTGPPIG
jgi:RNA polymerase sigma factor (sigma-70 family)